MSFTFLLIIASLAIIIPVIFSIKAKKHQTSSSSKTVLSSTTITSETEQKLVIDLNALPNLFQQIILDIEAQFFEITKKNTQNVVNTESYLTAKRLFYTRLPELVNDYLKLDPNYAKTQVIDTTHGLTSYDLVSRQLKSILNLFHQINLSSNEQYLQNILTNERYLTSVQQTQGLKTSDDKKTAINVSELIQPFDEKPHLYKDSDYQAGQDYLTRYLTNHQTFSDDFVRKIGQLVYFASITQLAINEELGRALAKLRISANLELEALSSFLAYQLPAALQQLPISNTPPMWLPAIDRLLVILQQMLDTLDKDLPTADKLALIQNLHDDFEQTVNENF